MYKSPRDLHRASMTKARDNFVSLLRHYSTAYTLRQFASTGSLVSERTVRYLWFPKPSIKLTPAISVTCRHSCSNQQLIQLYEETINVLVRGFSVVWSHAERNQNIYIKSTASGNDMLPFPLHGGNCYHQRCRNVDERIPLLLQLRNADAAAPTYHFKHT